MGKITTLFLLAGVLGLSGAAFAGAFANRLQQSEAQYKADEEAQRRADSLKQQLDLKTRVYAYAQKHGGLTSATCGSRDQTSCGFMAICLPTATYSINSLGRSASRDMTTCDVSFADHTACNLSNDWDSLYSARKGNRIPTLAVDCLDAHNQRKTSFVY